MSTTTMVRIQWVGMVPAKPAGDFAVGEWMMWNGGESTRILAVREASPAYLVFTFENTKGDGTHERRMMKSRPCAIGAAPRISRAAFEAHKRALAAEVAAAASEKK